MEHWLINFGLMVVVALAAFAIGCVVGGDAQRERLLKQLREQRRQNVGQEPWFPRGHS